MRNGTRQGQLCRLGHSHRRPGCHVRQLLSWNSIPSSSSGYITTSPTEPSLILPVRSDVSLHGTPIEHSLSCSFDIQHIFYYNRWWSEKNTELGYRRQGIYSQFNLIAVAYSTCLWTDLLILFSLSVNSG